MRYSSLLAIVIGLLPSAATAHGIWVAQRTGDLAIIYGHGAEDDAYKPDKIKTVNTIKVDGTAAPAKIVAGAKSVVIEPDPAAIAVASLMDNGFWTQTQAGKWINAGKKGIPDAKSASHSVKYNLHVIKNVPGGIKPTGAALEIIPMADPISARPGDFLEIQVLFKGKPAQDVAIISDYVNHSHDKTSEKTDASGKIKVMVGNDGLNVIAVSVSEPVAGNAEIDKVSHFATLSFALPHTE